jgi:dimeric dUTPase (all-alpha-NTP-PPase superfamily)
MSQVQRQPDAMLETMAVMQEEHNAQVHPQWRDQGYAYYRAIWVECAEMLDHFGWKWWKKQDADLNQVKLELVDIWHFALSELIRSGQLTPSIAEDLATIDGGEVTEPEHFRCAIELLASSALATRSFAVEPFKAAMAALPMSYDELFELYIGKNVLNQFRQNHGYKSGTYRKLWAGREDNEHLIEVLAATTAPAAELPQQLYAALYERYEASAD